MVSQYSVMADILAAPSASASRQKSTKPANSTGASFESHLVEQNRQDRDNASRSRDTARLNDNRNDARQDTADVRANSRQADRDARSDNQTDRTSSSASNTEPQRDSKSRAADNDTDRTASSASQSDRPANSDSAQSNAPEASDDTPVREQSTAKQTASKETQAPDDNIAAADNNDADDVSDPRSSLIDFLISQSVQVGSQIQTANSGTDVSPDDLAMGQTSGNAADGAGDAIDPSDLDALSKAMANAAQNATGNDGATDTAAAASDSDVAGNAQTTASSSDASTDGDAVDAGNLTKGTPPLANAANSNQPVIEQPDEVVSESANRPASADHAAKPALENAVTQSVSTHQAVKSDSEVAPEQPSENDTQVATNVRGQTVGDDAPVDEDAFVARSVKEAAPELGEVSETSEQKSTDGTVTTANEGQDIADSQQTESQIVTAKSGDDQTDAETTDTAKTTSGTDGTQSTQSDATSQQDSDLTLQHLAERGALGTSTEQLQSTEGDAAPVDTRGAQQQATKVSPDTGSQAGNGLQTANKPVTDSQSQQSNINTASDTATDANSDATDQPETGRVSHAENKEASADNKTAANAAPRGEAFSKMMARLDGQSGLKDMTMQSDQTIKLDAALPTQGDASTVRLTGMETLARTGQLPAQASLANAQALAAQISKFAGKGETRFEIRLDPADLGKVDVKLTIGSDGQTRAHVFVERSETLDFLMRDQRVLERSLQQSGLNLDKQGLQFSMMNQENQGQQMAGQDQQMYEQDAYAKNAGSAEEDVAAQSILEPQNTGTYLASNGLNLVI